MARKKGPKDIKQIRKFVDQALNAGICKCVRKGRAWPKCRVCEGTGRVKIRPLRPGN